MEMYFDYLIIGAGPAGLQLGYFLAQKERSFLILEQSAKPGAFFETFPRHRQLISINKVHTGKAEPNASLRWDWNSLLSDDENLLFKYYSQQYFPHADDLCRYLADYAHRFNLNIQYNSAVIKVSKQNQLFTVTDSNGATYTSKRLIIASGLFKPYIPDVPGAELCHYYDSHSTLLDEYVNKRVLIIGKGNSAFETANHLNEVTASIHLCSPHSVKMAWQTHYVGDLRAVNNDFLDTYQLKSQNVVIDGAITKIEQNGDEFVAHIAYSHAKGQTTTRIYDRVILCTGFQFDDSIFDASCLPELTIRDKFPAQTREWESANVEDMYFAGTLMQACDYRKSMSGFIHGFRHNIQSLSNLFEQKYHGCPWPCLTLSATPRAVLEKVLRRINNGPGIFLQPGFLRDLVVISESDGMARYYEDLRFDYIHDSPFGLNEHYYTISLEYGKFEGDPFSVARDPDPTKGNEASYLHPVIRRYNCNRLVSEHHLQDDLEGEWYRDEYVDPARAYFEEQLALYRAPQYALD